MNSFSEQRKKAQRKWDSLKASSIPVIYIGTATCGRAAGAVQVLETIRKTLKEKKLRAKIVQVGCIGPCYL